MGSNLAEKRWFSPALDIDDRLETLRQNGSDRKFRLLAVACCRRIESFMTRKHCVRAIERAERFADGLAGAEILSRSRTEFQAEQRSRLRKRVFETALAEGHESFDAERMATQWAATWDASLYVVRRDDHAAARLCCEAAAVVLANDPEDETSPTELGVLFHEIFGNPFRPVTFDPRWQSSTVLDLARTIYEDRKWERMPILADALMDAGCDSEEIIKHCQGPGPHTRGCWVVDLLTGRS